MRFGSGAGAALWHRHHCHHCHHCHHRQHRQPAWSASVAWAAVAVVTIEAALGIAPIGLFLVPVVVLLALRVRLVPGPAAPPAPARSAGSPATDS